jgi:group I intron endonuclease
VIPSASGIYRIRNLLTARIYVGSAVNMAKRWGIHLHQLRHNKHHSKKLQRAWNKAGEGSFVFEVLEIVDAQRNLLIREQFWIDSTNAYIAGYNCTPTAGSNMGVKFGKETRAKLSEARRARPPATKETREKMSRARAGKRLSNIHRERLAARNRERGAALTKARLEREAEARALRAMLRAIPPAPNCTCLHCGSAFYARPAEVVRGGKFCSARCYHASRVKDIQTRSCRKCGEKFSFPNGVDQRYCSPCAATPRVANRTSFGAERGVEWSEPESAAVPQ